MGEQNDFTKDDILDGLDSNQFCFEVLDLGYNGTASELFLGWTYQPEDYTGDEQDFSICLPSMPNNNKAEDFFKTEFLEKPDNFESPIMGEQNVGFPSLAQNSVARPKSRRKQILPLSSSASESSYDGKPAKDKTSANICETKKSSIVPAKPRRKKLTPKRQQPFLHSLDPSKISDLLERRRVKKAISSKKFHDSKKILLASLEELYAKQIAAEKASLEEKVKNSGQLSVFNVKSEKRIPQCCTFSSPCPQQ